MKRHEIIDDERFNFWAHYSVQVNDDIYGISENGLVVTRYANVSRGMDMVKTVLTEAVVSYEIR